MESIKEALIDVTYSWCKGASFEEICKMTDCYEGSVIRTLRRLDELLKQMGNACKVIGNQVGCSICRICSRSLWRLPKVSGEGSSSRHPCICDVLPE